MVKVIKIISTIIIIVAAIISLFPFAIMILFSLNSSANIKKGNYIPEDPIGSFIQNITNIAESGQLFTSIINTTTITISVTIIGVIISLLFSYITLKKTSSIHNTIFLLIIIGLLIPSSGIIVALFSIVSSFNLLNSIISVIIIEIPISFLVLLLFLSSKKFSYNLIEAARIDGVPEHKIFFKIYIRGIFSSIVIALVTTFISTWNNLLIPLVLLDQKNQMTMAVFLSSLNSALNPDLGVIMVGLLLNTIPALLLFLIFQKQFRKGFDLS